VIDLRTAAQTAGQRKSCIENYQRNAWVTTVCVLTNCRTARPNSCLRPIIEYQTQLSLITRRLRRAGNNSVRKKLEWRQSFFHQIAPTLAWGRHDGIRDRPLAAATDLSARFIGERFRARTVECLEQGSRQLIIQRSERRN